MGNVPRLGTALLLRSDGSSALTQAHTGFLPASLANLPIPWAQLPAANIRTARPARDVLAKSKGDGAKKPGKKWDRSCCSFQATLQLKEEAFGGLCAARTSWRDLQWAGAVLTSLDISTVYKKGSWGWRGKANVIPRQMTTSELPCKPQWNETLTLHILSLPLKRH